MGTRTTDDSYLYKPADGEGDPDVPSSSWSAEVNANLDRIGRLTTQIKSINPSGLDISGGPGVELYIITTGQISATAKLTIGATDLLDFNGVNGAALTQRADHYQHWYHLGIAGLSRDDIGMPDDGGIFDPTYSANVLIGIWEEINGTWVMVASGWYLITDTGGGVAGPIF
jgi:hypothetical protein